MSIALFLMLLLFRCCSHSAPDFGIAYVPNAGPSHLAPKSLDHFKRGYHERTAQREKEHYTRYHGHTGRGGRTSSGRGGGDINRSSRPVIVRGLNINEAIERLARLNGNQNSLFRELDQIFQQVPDATGVGKVITVMISTAARLMELGVGNAIWDWMDANGVKKNTFHYNSMISVTEKARNYQRALSLMREMKEKGISKNEVTYVDHRLHGILCSQCPQLFERYFSLRKVGKMGDCIGTTGLDG